MGYVNMGYIGYVNVPDLKNGYWDREYALYGP